MTPFKNNSISSIYFLSQQIGMTVHKSILSEQNHFNKAKFRHCVLSKKHDYNFEEKKKQLAVIN